MKIRKGFVSNSSSCSFVVSGFKISKDDDTLYRLITTLYKDEWKEYKDNHHPKFDDINITERKQIFMDFIYDVIQDYDILTDDEDGYKSDTHFIIGDTIASGDEYNFDKTETTVTDIFNMNSSLENTLIESIIKYERVIVTGTRIC